MQLEAAIKTRNPCSAVQEVNSFGCYPSLTARLVPKAQNYYRICRRSLGFPLGILITIMQKDLGGPRKLELFVLVLPDRCLSPLQLL